MRWRIALLLTGCILLAWRLGTIQATLHFGGPWHICIAVMATWPIYVFGVFECAKSESRTLSLAGHWETLTIHDQLGEMNDHNVSGKIDRGVNKVWDSPRYARGNNGGEILAVAILAIGTLGTWTIWDLIRMAPALVAEVIVDGILIPAQPSLAGRIPASPWWKYTLPIRHCISLPWGWEQPRHSCSGSTYFSFEQRMAGTETGTYWTY